MNVVKATFLLLGLGLLVGCASNRTPGGDAGTGTDSGMNKLEEMIEVSQSERDLPDRDNDGIADALDKCAESPAGSLVDRSGCEIELGAIKGLEFGPNETELSADARIVLSEMVDVFLRYPDTVISVEGHTDNRGAALANLELSKQRVLAVVRYMVTNGIAPARIRPYGYGESRPIAANATPSGRERNRRIEINRVERLL